MRNKIDYTRLTALVTGASSGIGEEFARQLAAKGVKLIIVSNERERIVTVADDIAATYQVEVTPVYMDLARTEAAKELYDFCREKGFAVDVLINNAGIFIFKEVVETAPERIDLIMNLHICTVTRLCRLFGEDMRKRGSGYILNMSSLSCWMPMPGIALYSATKAYIRVFTRSLWHELHEHGVTAMVACPGGIATSLYNLDPKLLKLGVRIGVLMTPKRLVRKALRRLFKGKKQIIPGLINRIFVPIVPLLPNALIRFGKHKLLKQS